MPIIITGFEKKGPILTCLTDEPGKTYKFDFGTLQAYGLRGQILKTTSPIIQKIGENHYEGDNRAFAYGLMAIPRNPAEKQDICAVVESLLSYPDLIPNDCCDFRQAVFVITHSFGGKLPKGFIPWCRDNNTKITENSLRDFEELQKIKGWPQNIVEKIWKIKKGLKVDLPFLTNYDEELCASLISMIDNSIKKYEIAYIVDWIKDIIYILAEPEYRHYLDKTKSIKDGYHILMEAKNEAKSKKILENERRIATLDETIINGIMVKIPSCMEDFTQEGSQQHNCVGHFYHNDMEAGTQLIYFLRRPEKPDESFVTCRFSVRNKKTVEKRIKFNEPYQNKTLFEEIDKMINALL